jgi:hypothetical protein
VKGYLESPYLERSYLDPQTDAAKGLQVSFVISKPEALSVQAEGVISYFNTIGIQADQQIQGNNDRTKAQVFTFITGEKANHLQVAQQIEDQAKALALQALQTAGGKTKRTGLQVRMGKTLFMQPLEMGYLASSYLTRPYLAPFLAGHLKTQVQFKTSHEKPVHTQVDIQVADVPRFGKIQREGKITKKKRVGVQINRVAIKATGIQSTISLYNIDNLRILYDFSSRGYGANAGTNWTASSTMAGDFSVNNLNTDIVEQSWRSNGLKSGVTLSCDTGITQGVFMDTFAMLAHNLTTSASVVLQGSMYADFQETGFNEVLTSKRNNIYWIAPSLPLSAYRYWRIAINDPSNTAAFLQIGAVLFGKSLIFQGDNFIDEVSRATKHFADKVETEGFTNVTVDRALKFSVGLEFRNLVYEKQNYNRIKDVFDTCRTGLKALWIPTPKFPDRFAVFGKLTAIPAEKHNVMGDSMDFVNFSVEVDESL